MKEYAGLAGVCLAIACCGDYDGLRSMTDYYEMLYSLGEQFLEEEQFFELVYQSPGEERLVMMRIDNAFDFKNTIQDMYYHLNHNGQIVSSNFANYYLVELLKSLLYLNYYKLLKCLKKLVYIKENYLF